ncbi:hypothetical protein L210DRAFT_876247, partial [Boletus edulis BED1]
MPIEWTTDEQKAFLQEELVQFKRMGGRRYTKLCLTKEQADTLSKAVLTRQQQLRRWMHWHAGAGRNRTVNNKTAKIINDLLKPKTRMKKPWEVYSKIYYKTRIQPQISAGMPIADVNKKIREMFESETAEIRVEVFRLCEEQKQDMRKRAAEGEEGGTEKATDATGEASRRDPDLLQGNIQRCGAALQQVLEHLEIQTGWKFSVLMGGPDPMDPEGANVIASLHVGKTKDDKDFAGVYAGFDTTVIEAYGEFLAAVFCKLFDSATGRL